MICPIGRRGPITATVVASAGAWREVVPIVLEEHGAGNRDPVGDVVGVGPVTEVAGCVGRAASQAGHRDAARSTSPSATSPAATALSRCWPRPPAPASRGRSRRGPRGRSTSCRPSPRSPHRRSTSSGQLGQQPAVVARAGCRSTGCTTTSPTRCRPPLPQPRRRRGAPRGGALVDLGRHRVTADLRLVAGECFVQAPTPRPAAHGCARPCATQVRILGVRLEVASAERGGGAGSPSARASRRRPSRVSAARARPRSSARLTSQVAARHDPTGKHTDVSSGSTPRPRAPFGPSRPERGTSPSGPRRCARCRRRR